MNLHQELPIRPNVVLVGGVDPGGGAGVLRDMLATIELGGQPAVVVTAITDQDSSRVTSIEPRDPQRVRQSLVAVLARLHELGAPVAVKIGMVANAEIARALEEALAAFDGPVVYDPVARASSGGALYEGDREAIVGLARRASLLTPNLGEASWLLDRPVRSLADAEAAARDLLALGIPAVLVKGGHLAGDASDVLLDRDGLSVLTQPRVPGPSPRGTGCSLASAIAVGLAGGSGLRTAVGAAKAWLTKRIAHATQVGAEWHLS